MSEGDLLNLFDAIANHNTFKLLQASRNLLDAGKAPRLMLSTLLQSYRDLLILKAAPGEADCTYKNGRESKFSTVFKL